MWKRSKSRRRAIPLTCPGIVGEPVEQEIGLPGDAAPARYRQPLGALAERGADPRDLDLGRMIAPEVPLDHLGDEIHARPLLFQVVADKRHTNGQAQALSPRANPASTQSERSPARRVVRYLRGPSWFNRSARTTSGGAPLATGGASIGERAGALVRAGASSAQKLPSPARRGSRSGQSGALYVECCASVERAEQYRWQYGASLAKRGAQCGHWRAVLEEVSAPPRYAEVSSGVAPLGAYSGEGWRIFQRYWANMCDVCAT